jgi:hypothetical protein
MSAISTDGMRRHVNSVLTSKGVQTLTMLLRPLRPIINKLQPVGLAHQKDV